MTENKIARQFTCTDVQALSLFNSLKLTAKQRNQDNIFQWVIENKIQPYQLRLLLEE